MKKWVAGSRKQALDAGLPHARRAQARRPVGEKPHGGWRSSSCSRSAKEPPCYGTGALRCPGQHRRARDAALSFEKISYTCRSATRGWLPPGAQPRSQCGSQRGAGKKKACGRDPRADPRERLPRADHHFGRPPQLFYALGEPPHREGMGFFFPVLYRQRRLRSLSAGIDIRTDIRPTVADRPRGAAQECRRARRDSRRQRRHPRRGQATPATRARLRPRSGARCGLRRS